MIVSSRREFLSLAGRYAVLGLGSVSALTAVISGCKEMEVIADIGTSIGVASGNISESQAESIKKSAMAVSRSFQEITPEQEYYIGRTVGAVIVDKYRPYENDRANTYVNLLGQSLAQASDLPETYGGYHFLIQDSDEINALSAPGGLIFVTRGILRCCKHEDAVAAVLAHEIGHVQLKHGLQAIHTSRVTGALTTLAMEGTKTFGGEQLAELTKTFEGSITDITATLINNGYSRTFESQADMGAVTIMRRVGYDPNGLVDMLDVMRRRLKPGGLDFARTHPSPTSRVAEIQKIIGRYAGVKSPRVRQTRFMRALGNV